ncbi:hypothetical protein IOD13_09305 [Brevibacterium casei]|nr:hypothetical protein [Brevibacterium casei]
MHGIPDAIPILPSPFHQGVAEIGDLGQSRDHPCGVDAARSEVRGHPFHNAVVGSPPVDIGSGIEGSTLFTPDGLSYLVRQCSRH